MIRGKWKSGVPIHCREGNSHGNRTGVEKNAGLI